MNNLFIILLMIFLHIVDDFCLQIPWLASGKQKSMWQEKAPDKLYKYDYLCALILHAFSWTFMIMLPIAFTLHFNITSFFIFIFVINMIVHACIDDMKANKKLINLWIDQIAHICQIGLTALYFL